MSDTQTRLTGRALGEAVLAVVTEQPELHNQSLVTCGSAACIAGWAIALHVGMEPGAELTGQRPDAWFELCDRFGAGADDVAEALLFGEDVDESTRLRFVEEVFVADEETAITNLRAMLPEMPVTA
jgi:hypothetical protein